MSARARAIGVLAAAAVAVVVVLLSSTDSGSHTLRAGFEQAPLARAGQEVRLAGARVGSVADVDYVDGQAALKLEISDERAWPLPRGTVARLRFGSTISYGGRYVELIPGPASADDLPDGGLLSSADGHTLSPVEFDELFNIMDRPARENLDRVLETGARGLRGRAADIRAGLRDMPGAFRSLADMLRELGADREALRTLVTAGADVSTGLAEREVAVRGFVTHAAATFDEFAQHQRAIRASLDRFPTTLRVSRTTLGRLDGSLAELDGLMDDLAPGARVLPRFARQASRTLTNVRDVAPEASSALRRARAGAPAITELLEAGTPFMRRLRSVTHGLAPALACIRPYGPEIAGTVATWAGFTKNFDGLDHYARMQTAAIPAGNGSQMTSEQLVAAFPGVMYAFPRAPGTDANQPFFQSQCGVGPEGFDASADPEASP